MRDDLKQNLFEQLVANGFDFLERGVGDLKTDAKAALASFATGLELVLKARLFLEHWALVAQNPHAAAWTGLKDGTTMTIQASDLPNTLARITGAPNTEASAVFAGVFQHRNAVVHWMPKADETALAAEQYRAWFHLQSALRRQWAREFEHASGRIAHIDSAIKEHREYLDYRYSQAETKLDAQRKSGRVFACGLCGYHAVVVETAASVASEATCLVCESSDVMTRLPCDAWASFYVLPLDCAACKNTHSSDDVLEELDPTPSMSPKEMYGYQDSRAFCGECFSFPKSVVPASDEHVCLCCNERFVNGISTCEYCNEQWVGYDCEFTYYSGCEHCDGRGYKD